MSRRPQLSFEAETKELNHRFETIVKLLGLKKSHIFNQAMKDLIDEFSEYPGGIRGRNRRVEVKGHRPAKSDLGSKVQAPRPIRRKIARA
jgi:hypothetical protein